MGRLTAVAVRTARADGKYSDGNGLLLVVRAGRRAWHYRFQRTGRERVMSLGDADVVSLAEARRLHAEARALLLAGHDPLEARARTKADRSHSFAAVADIYITTHAPKWKNPRTAPQWRASLRDHALPLIGKLPVAEIDTHHVLRVLKPIWYRIPETASRVRNRIEAIIDYATAMHWRTGANPAVWRGGLRSLLPAKSDLRPVKHHVALPWQDCPALIGELQRRDNIASVALRFLILTATRSGEARGATWSEIDVPNAVWTIPPERMKARRLHRVPLSSAAMTILRRMAELRSSDLVFPDSRQGHKLADVTLLRQLRGLGHSDIVVHGFRSTFRDWCADTGKSSDLAEAALAHAPPSKVVQAYQRSDLLEARRRLMSDWAAYLDRAPATVVALRVASS